MQTGMERQTYQWKVSRPLISKNCVGGIRVSAPEETEQMDILTAWRGLPMGMKIYQQIAALGKQYDAERIVFLGHAIGGNIRNVAT